MKIYEVTDSEAVGKQLDKQYQQKMKQVAPVSKGIYKELNTAYAKLKKSSPDTAARDMPNMITDIVNKIVDYNNPKNNQPPYVNKNPNGIIVKKDVMNYIQQAVKAKYQETIYGSVNRGTSGDGTDSDTAAGSQPKPNDPTAGPGDTVQTAKGARVLGVDSKPTTIDPDKPGADKAIEKIRKSAGLD